MEDHSGRLTRADLITGFVLVLLGLTVFYLAWVMPRLESRGIHPSTIPGLVPMVLGGLLAFSGLLLSLRAWRQRVANPVRTRIDLRVLATSEESKRLAVMLILTLSYALVLIGWLPFWFATALYVFSSIVLYERYLTSEPKPLRRCLLSASIQSILVAVVITLIFQEGFLVRLP